MKNRCILHHSQRRGTTLLLVVLCLILVTAILGAMINRVMLANRQIKQRSRLAQATWLAESGIERAVFSLRQDENYRDETWTLTSKDLNGTHGARVEIEVSETDANFVVSVQASYPDSGEFRATSRKSISIAREFVRLPEKENE